MDAPVAWCNNPSQKITTTELMPCKLTTFVSLRGLAKFPIYSLFVFTIFSALLANDLKAHAE